MNCKIQDLKKVSLHLEQENNKQKKRKQKKMDTNKQATVRSDIGEAVVATYHITPGSSYHVHAIKPIFNFAKSKVGAEIQNDQGNRRIVPLEYFKEKVELSKLPVSEWRNMPKTKHH